MMDERGNGACSGFDAYVEALIEVIGHADRAEPLREAAPRDCYSFDLVAPAVIVARSENHGE